MVIFARIIKKTVYIQTLLIRNTSPF